MKHNPIILALDFESADEARKLIAALGDSVDFYKVGLELYAAAGMDFVRELGGQGKRAFLDLKMYDIGETVKRAVRQAARAQATFLTVHGSVEVMRAAVEGRADAPLKLLAVTVLTSFDRRDLLDLGYPCGVDELVALRTRNAMAAGIDGVVCSALDVSRVRSIAGPDAILVTPGVRSRASDAGDQKRVATPAEAVAWGADYIVVGRQVTRSAEPRAEVARILEQVRSSAPAATTAATPSAALP